MEGKIDLVKGFPEDLYRERYAKVKSTQICMRCGEPVRENNSPSSKLEHRVLALCEACRNDIIYRCLHRDKEPDPS